VTVYLLDTNAVSDLITYHEKVQRVAAQHLIAGDSLGLCRPIHYEILRGISWRGATSKLSVYRQEVIPMMQWIDLIDSDWEDAAHLWADARRKGRQLGDPDILLATLSRRLRAIMVSFRH
jgi:predicted nucleic acid-binding protein